MNFNTKMKFGTCIELEVIKIQRIDPREIKGKYELTQAN